MNEEDFHNLLGNTEDDSSIRMQYGNHIGYLKEWLMQFGEPIVWMQSAFEGWDEFDNITLDNVKESMQNIFDYLSQGAAKLYGIIQESAEQLYGEELPMDSFHIVGCECDYHNKEEE